MNDERTKCKSPYVDALAILSSISHQPTAKRLIIFNEIFNASADISCRAEREMLFKINNKLIKAVEAEEANYE